MSEDVFEQDRPRRRRRAALYLLALAAAICGVLIALHFAFARADVECKVTIQTPKPEPVAVTKNPVSFKDQYVTAIHEAGHVLLHQAYLPEVDLHDATLLTERADADDLGYVTPGDGRARDAAAYVDLAESLFYIGGTAAEEVIFGGDPKEDDVDRDGADAYLLLYCGVAACECPPESRVGKACLLYDQIRTLHARLHRHAVTCLGANKQALVELANALFTQAPKDGKRALGADALKAFFASHPLATCDPP